MAPRLTEVVASAAVVSGIFASSSHAQSPFAPEVLTSATELVAALEAPGGCDLSIHGAPRFDETTQRWLIAYSGVGPQCDDTSAALQREGRALGLAFFRRPNSAEVRALMGGMRTSLRRGFDCLLAFHGEPRFDDESALWTVRYSGSGYQCEDAGAELERRGREFRITFYRAR
jgi:hypothetical protein